jgi:hypothetical protein
MADHIERAEADGAGRAQDSDSFQSGPIVLKAVLTVYAAIGPILDSRFSILDFEPRPSLIGAQMNVRQR